MITLIEPDWPAPSRVKAYSTTRSGGFSKPPYASFNLSSSGGDDPEDVKRNRTLLVQQLHLPTEPVWLHQVHGTQAVLAEQAQAVTTADAAYTYQANIVCGVLTGDCLPLLICNRQATVVAAIHAGWKGLLAGVIEATIDKIESANSDLLVWLGPAIGPQAFEVGAEVLQQFVAVDPNAAAAFYSKDNGRYRADIYHLARQRLQQCGVDQIYGGNFCTYEDEQRFFSYRRDVKTGRMASIIWLAASGSR